jgi:transcriptional regulator with XRE-family HTH domain
MATALNRFLTRLRELRKMHNLTQEQFSELSGISYKYYQALEAGRKQEVRLSTLERVARAYGFEVYQLLSPELPMPKQTKRRGMKPFRPSYPRSLAHRRPQAH